MPDVAEENGPVWRRTNYQEGKRPELAEAGDYIGLRADTWVQNHEQGKRPDAGGDEPRRPVRPDGQSPDSGGAEPLAARPGAALSCSTLSDVDNSAADDLEYDDYIPNLPGSYFEMDPHAYTLTWSQQAHGGSSAASRKQPPPCSLSASEASLEAR